MKIYMRKRDVTIWLYVTVINSVNKAENLVNVVTKSLTPSPSPEVRVFTYGLHFHNVIKSIDEIQTRALEYVSISVGSRHRMQLHCKNETKDTLKVIVQAA